MGQTYNNINQASKLAAIFAAAVISISLVITSSVTAESKTEADVSVNVVNGCSMLVDNHEHSAAPSPGTYLDMIGEPTTFQIACNDTNIYSVYAIGYSNDTEGQTSLINLDNSESNIVTGVAQNGSISNWAFRLYDNSDGVTILPGYDSPSLIPASSTLIAQRTSGFHNTGTNEAPIYDSFKVAYSAFISQTQPAGTYTGKVKYTLFNQGIQLVYGDTCNETGKVMKDGKCWSALDVATSVQWYNASSYCSGIWHLPSQQEFDQLLLSYYPNAKAYPDHHGHNYAGSTTSSTSAFAADWGVTSGYWWSSAEYGSSHGYGLSLSGSQISSFYFNPKTDRLQVRCVSDV